MATETPPVVIPPVVTPPVTPPVVPPVVAPPDHAAQAAADAAAAAAAQKPPVVTPPVVPPAEVKFELALPKDAVIEAAAIERTTAFAKAAGLSPEVAQKTLDHANAEVAADRVQQKAAHAEAFKTLATKQWVEDVKADHVYGGEKYLTTVEEVKRAADRFLTNEERAVLNQTGWGNHPLLVKMFARIGQAMKDDKLVMGGGAGGTESQSAAQVLYGKTMNDLSK